MTLFLWMALFRGLQNMKLFLWMTPITFYFSSNLLFNSLYCQIIFEQYFQQRTLFSQMRVKWMLCMYLMLHHYRWYVPWMLFLDSCTLSRPRIIGRLKYLYEGFQTTTIVISRGPIIMIIYHKYLNNMNTKYVTNAWIRYATNVWSLDTLCRIWLKTGYCMS